MVNIKHVLKLNYPVDAVYETFRDNPVTLAAKIPQLKKVEVMSREDTDDGQTLMRVKFFGRADIPEMFRPVLNPDMLRWVSAQEWNNDELTSCYRVETFYFKERVNVGGKWCFRSDGNGGTIISVQGHIRIHTDGIPGLPAPIARVAGDMIEKFLERNSTPNMRRMCNSLEKLLKEKYPEKS